MVHSSIGERCSGAIAIYEFFFLGLHRAIAIYEFFFICARRIYFKGSLGREDDFIKIEGETGKLSCLQSGEIPPEGDFCFRNSSLILRRMSDPELDTIIWSIVYRTTKTAQNGDSL